MKKLILSLIFFMSGASALGSQVTLQPTHILTACSMTGTAVCTSSVVDARYLVQTGFQLYWTGTPSGTFSIQASKNGGTNWTDIGAGISNAAGAAGDRLANIQTGSYTSLRVVYTNTASTGTLDVWADGKGY